jgi:hypothetical protein
MNGITKWFGWIGIFCLAVGIWRWSNSKVSQNPLPAGYGENRLCPASERDIVDLFEKTVADLPHKEFRYRPAKGCWAELVLPGFSDKWSVQTANPERLEDWIAIRCTDGRIALQPQTLNSKSHYFCGGRDVKERNTFFYQGNTELFFKAP